MRQVVAAQHVEYKKWLRYFLDFCNKYSPPDSKSEQIRLFCEKLRAKRQSESQCRFATHAVSLFFEMRQDNLSASPEVVDCPEETNVVDSSTKVNEPSEKWLPVSRGSSGYTEAGYQERSDSPELDELLAMLASEIKVRHYSRKTLKTYANWSCTLTVHGKGKKDRTVPLPESITQELKTQIKKSLNSMNRTCQPGTTEYFWMTWWRKSIPRHLRNLSTSGSFPRNL